MSTTPSPKAGGRAMRVGINGFGRIGRTVFRQILAREGMEVVAINDLGHNPANLCYMLKYDSIHGALRERVELREHAQSEKDWTVSEIFVGDDVVQVFSEDKIESVPWNEIGCDIVIDATGNGRNLKNARLALGRTVQRVIVTNSPDQLVDFTFVFDVNDTQYDPATHKVIAASICDAVGLAPMIARLENRYGVTGGFVTTLHPWLGYQNLLDGKPSSLEFKERPDIYEASTYLVMGRSSVGTMIPKSTSAVAAIEKVLPSIKGKLKGMSFRVPTDVVGGATVTLQLAETPTTQELRDFLRESAREPYFRYTEEPLISIDYKHCESSCIIDGKWVESIEGGMMRFIAWYDNEWGYSARVVDVAAHVYEPRGDA